MIEEGCEKSGNRGVVNRGPELRCFTRREFRRRVNEDVVGTDDKGEAGDDQGHKHQPKTLQARNRQIRSIEATDFSHLN